MKPIIYLGVFKGDTTKLSQSLKEFNGLGVDLGLEIEELTPETFDKTTKKLVEMVGDALKERGHYEKTN